MVVQNPKVKVLQAINDHFELGGEDFTVAFGQQEFPDFLANTELLTKQIENAVADLSSDKLLNTWVSFGGISVAGVTSAGRSYLYNFM